MLSPQRRYSLSYRQIKRRAQRDSILLSLLHFVLVFFGIFFLLIVTAPGNLP